MNKFTRKYLIITAHPDDLEMGCGGLVSRVIKEGGTVTNLILVKPSAEHNDKRDENLVSYAESFIQDHDILISHWREDHHQDHRVCYDVARSISRKHFEQFWCMDQPPYNLHYKNFDCNQYIDITDYVDQKRKLLESYKTYFNNDSIETIINYNKYRGSFLGAGKVAETFQIMYNKNI